MSTLTKTTNKYKLISKSAGYPVLGLAKDPVSVRRKSLKLLLLTALGGTTLGTSLAGAKGLSNLNTAVPSDPPAEIDVPLPYPQQKRAASPTVLASTGMGRHYVPFLSLAHLAGRTADTPTGHPLFLPAALATLLGTTAGSSALTNKLLHAKRQSNLDAELGNAEKEYTNTILGQYEPEKIHKLQKSAVINSKLDALFDKIAGQVTPIAQPNADYRSAGLGLALSALGLGAGIGAAGGYSYASGKSQDEALIKALKHRALLRSLQGPQAISTHPVLAKAEKETVQ